MAALSDLHIGLDPRHDAFGHEPAVFEQQLRRLRETHDRLVLLGDLFTADHAARWGARFAEAHLRRILVRVPWLADLLQQDDVHYVHGNHDLAAAAVVGAAERVVLDGARARVLFTHGHQFDPVARKALVLAQAGTWATGRMRALRLSGVAQWFEDRDVAIKDARFRGAGGPYASAADRLCRDEQVSAVVMGHTHAARVDRTPHGVSLNTGTCSTGRLEFASLDLDRGTAVVTRGVERIHVSLLK